jgi:pyrrolysyl-tRNA synthetase-like protein
MARPFGCEAGMDEKKVYYRKRSDLYGVIDKMKLWPARSGMLHGIKGLTLRANYIEITTHCGKTLRVFNSRNSRAARWMRNKWAATPCPECRVPQWKLEKYAKTFFSEHYGKDLSKQTPKDGETE